MYKRFCTWYNARISSALLYSLCFLSLKFEVIPYPRILGCFFNLSSNFISLGSFFFLVGFNYSCWIWKLEGQRENRDRYVLHDGSLPKELKWLVLEQTESRSLDHFWFPTWILRPNDLYHIPCFPRCISMELEQKWSCWDLNMPIETMALQVELCTATLRCGALYLKFRFNASQADFCTQW